MPLTLNDPSPCGRGTIKYVCRELAADLEKVSRAVEANQRRSALQQLNGILSTKGSQPPLLAMKLGLQLDLRNIDQAKKTAAEFIQKFPDYSVAWAYSALLAVSDNDLLSAATRLQKTLQVEIERAAQLTSEKEEPEKKQEKKQKDKERKTHELPQLVYVAIGVVAQGLLVKGNVLAARAHLGLQMTFSQQKDPQVAELLSTILSSPNYPLLLKQSPDLTPMEASEGLAGLDENQLHEFFSAVAQTQYGLWLSVIEKLQGLAKTAPQSLAIRWNLAILYGFLGDTKNAAAEWRRVALLPGVTEDQAVEAEAIAQLLEPSPEVVKEVELTHTLLDHAKALEQLQASRQASAMTIDLNTQRKGDAPPPKAAFLLLDRPLPTTSENLTADDVPCILATLLLYGKQTDRPARLESTFTRTKDFPSPLEALKQVLGDTLKKQEEEKVLREIPAAESALSFRWRLPDGTPPSEQVKLIRQQRQKSILENWAALPMALFGGKAPREAKNDAKYRIALQAAVRNLEMRSWQTQWGVDFDAIRQQLELPPAAPIDPRRKDIPSLSASKYGYLLIDKLSDEALLFCYQQAASLGINSVVKQMAKEVIRRDSLDGVVSKAEALGVLAGLASDPAQKLDLLIRAQRTASRQGESPAQWLIGEMALQAAVGDLERWQQLALQIQANHLEEPQVAEMLAVMLVQAGVMNPQGAPGPAARARGGPIDLNLFQPLMEAIKQQAPSEDEGKFVKPAQAKSKLWLPGT